SESASFSACVASAWVHFLIAAWSAKALVMKNRMRTSEIRRIRILSHRLRPESLNYLLNSDFGHWIVRLPIRDCFHAIVRRSDATQRRVIGTAAVLPP